MIDAQTVAGISMIVSALLGGGLIGVLLRHRRDFPGAMASARKTGAEAQRLEVETENIAITTLEGQVRRLDERVESLEEQVEDCHKDRDLALAAARFLWDRLSIVAPEDKVLDNLRDYIKAPPIRRTPRHMDRQLRDIRRSDEPA